MSQKLSYYQHPYFKHNYDIWVEELFILLLTTKSHISFHKNDRNLHMMIHSISWFNREVWIVCRSTSPAPTIVLILWICFISSNLSSIVRKPLAELTCSAETRALVPEVCLHQQETPSTSTCWHYVLIILGKEYDLCQWYSAYIFCQPCLETIKHTSFSSCLPETL